MPTHVAGRGLAVLWLFAVAGLAAAPAAAQQRDEVTAPERAILAQAALERAPLWRLPLAGALVEDMRLLTPDRLLLALRSDVSGLPNLQLALVDARTGVERWRYLRKNLRARWDLVLADSLLLVYRVDDVRKPRLVAIDARSGAESWTAEVAPGAVPLANRPDGTLLVVEPGRSQVELRSLALADGAERWKREVRAATKDASPPRPVLDAQDAIHFYRGVERLAGADGHPLWSRPDLVVPDGAPDARLDDGSLFVVTAGGSLAELDAATGATRHTVALPADLDWDAIEAFADRVFVRGSSSGGGAYVLAAVDRGEGRLLWSHSTALPPMSNVVRHEDRVFYATPGRVVALDAATGSVAGEWEATNASRPYPIHLRMAGGKVVYIGELMVAAFDPKTGEKAWSQGWTPISNNASLVALDAALPRLREQLDAIAGRKPRGAKTGADASFARVETARFQNMAADYSRRADELSAQVPRTGSPNERAIARLGVQIERSSAVSARSADIAITRMNAAIGRAQATMNFQFAIMDLQLAMARARAIAITQSEMDRQGLYRRAVLSGYSSMEDDDWVYRPASFVAVGGGGFSGVGIVHLASGHASRTLLSPAYRNYGLWNLVDFERGVVYHHGIGLEPGRYRFMPPRDIGGRPTSIIGNFLIAAPIRIPK